MINGTSTKFSKEFLSTKCSEILNYKGPQMKHIVPRDTITLFYYYNLCSQQLCFYSSSKATWSRSNNKNLQSTEIYFNISYYQYSYSPNGSPKVCGLKFHQLQCKHKNTIHASWYPIPSSPNNPTINTDFDKNVAHYCFSSALCRTAAATTTLFWSLLVGFL